MSKRTENNILRITISKQKIKLKPSITALPPSLQNKNSAGELKSTAERSHHDFVYKLRSIPTALLKQKMP